MYQVLLSKNIFTKYLAPPFLKFLQTLTPPTIYYFFLKIFIYLFIYLAVPGLSCGTRDLRCRLQDLLVAACMQDLALWSGIEPGPPALGVQSLNHWTTREVLAMSYFWSSLPWSPNWRPPYLVPISLPLSSHLLSSNSSSFFVLISWPHCTACGILVPWPGIKPWHPALEAWSLNHWTARGVLHFSS